MDLEKIRIAHNDLKKGFVFFMDQEKAELTKQAVCAHFDVDLEAALNCVPKAGGAGGRDGGTVAAVKRKGGELPAKRKR